MQGPASWRDRPIPPCNPARKRPSDSLTESQSRGRGSVDKAARASSDTRLQQNPSSPTLSGKRAASKTTGRTPARLATAGKAQSAGKETSGSTTKPVVSRDEAAYRITPEEALSNTRKLLADKQARDRNRSSGPGRDAGESASARHAAFQSVESHDKVGELHEGDMELNAIKVNVSDRDRRQQGKRDNR